MAECAYRHSDGGPCQFGEIDTSFLGTGEFCEFHIRAGLRQNWSKDDLDRFNKKILDVIDRAPEGGKADLVGVVFSDVHFSNQKALPKLDVRDATFSGDVNFTGGTFSAYTDFAEFTFGGDTSFAGVTFRGHANFAEVTFSQNADFAEVTFSQNADFAEVGFSGYANFTGATFRRHAYFAGATFSRYTDFIGVGFSGYADFNNGKFQQSTSFCSCTFDAAPTFHQAELHQDTDFDGAKFSDWTSDGAARAYRTLKLAMEKVRSRQEEARFYALEQKALRSRPDTLRWVKLVSKLYETTSDYGQSALRPFGWFVAVNLAAFCIYSLIAAIDLYPAGFDLAGVADFSVQQALAPFHTWIRGGRDGLRALVGTDLTPSGILWVRLLAAVQSLISTSMLALTALALRWRFRRG